MTATPPTGDTSPRKVALTAGLGLLAMALLAAFAQFGVLQSLVVPGNASATIASIGSSEELFRLGVGAFLVVTFLDILVAWSLYVLLRPVNRGLALLVGWFRLAAAAAFAVALANLLDVANLVGAAEGMSLRPELIQAQVMASLASFETGWDMSLAIFGLHLGGLGYLLFRSGAFPRFLGALVVIAGGGYLADSFIRILAPDVTFTFSLFTFVGEVLLIGWLLWRAAIGFGSKPLAASQRAMDPRLTGPTVAA